MSLKIYRLDWKYKFLEAFIGSSSLLFLFFVTVLSFIAPYPLAIFLIIYSFLMILRLGFHLILAISAYKNLTRFDAVDWTGYLKFLDTKPTSVELETKNSQLKKQFATNENWHNFIDAQATNYNLLEPKFQQPNSVVHFLIFSTYNESSEVLTRGLLSIFENGYDLSHLFVFVSQEERAGAEFNRDTRNTIGANDWIQILEFSESDLNAVYAPDHPSLNYTNSELKNKVQSLDPKKLTIIFTQHPDGLDGEIIGKAANEDSAAARLPSPAHNGGAR